MMKFAFGRGCLRPAERALGDSEVDIITTNTGMDREEVEVHYEKFLSNHKNGRISKRSFQALLQQSYPGAEPAVLTKLAQHIFRMYDTNQDGHIDFIEFMLALYIMNNGSAEANLKQIFRVFDINNDGAISLKELQKIVKDLHKLLKDQTDDSEENFAKIAFTEMDNNGDGKVDEEEFISACLTRRKASTSLTLKIVGIFVADGERDKTIK